jgi:hypothetical protein
MQRILVILILFLISCSKNPQEPEVLLGIITGRITDFETNEPLPGARVTTSPTTSSKITDASGSYTIPDVEPGTYVVTSEKDGYITRSVSVNVEADRNVSADLQLPALKPALGVTSTRMNFGTGTTSLTFNISNITQHGSLQWTISENTDWLTVSPTNGTTADEMDQITVTVDRTGLIYGNHNTQLQISSNGGEVYIDVLIVVQNPNVPQLTVDKQDLDFGDRETSRQFNITNTGTGDLVWSISEGYGWLDVSSLNGSTSNETEPIIITVNRNNLDQDIYSANLSVSSNGGNTTINVRMEVSEAVIPPVTLSEPSDITETSMHLAWTRIEHQNFKYYRLFRSSSPGVTESSTMIFESSNIRDNYFTDSMLQPSTTYHYRVFVIDSDDVSCGSNEVKITTRMKEGRWSLVRSFENAEFYGLELIDENHGFISGKKDGQPCIIFFEGTNFIEERLPEELSRGAAILDVSFISIDDIWAVHSSGVIHFDGFEWSVAIDFPEDTYICLQGTPSGDVWVGARHNIYQYDGSEIIVYDTDYFVYDFLYFDVDDIYASSSGASLRHFDGFGWSDLENTCGAYTLDGLTSNSIWIASKYGSNYGKVYHFNGNECNLMLEVETYAEYGGFVDIEVITESMIWVVGDRYTRMYSYDGIEWQEFDNPFPFSFSLITAIEFASGIGWAVDEYGNIIRYSTL